MTETINLYGEDGIAIGLTAETDIVEHDSPEASVVVVGHRIYCCSVEDAERLIRAEYLTEMGIADPLEMIETRRNRC